MGVVLYLKNDKIKTLINNIIHISPTGNPSETQEAEGNDESEEETTQTETEEPPAAQSTAQIAPAVVSPAPAIPTPAIPTPAAPVTDGTIEKDCYIKTKGPDEAGTGMWLLLTDDNGPVNAHYAKKDANDGFAKVKGIMKTENGKSFLEVSEIKTEE